MKKDTIILTRKIQIFIDCDDKEKRSEYYAKLFEWQDMVFRGANLVMTHQFIQEQMKDLIYLTDDVKVKLADGKKDPEGILKTSRMNTTYQVLSRYFKGKLNSDIMSSLNKMLIGNFNAERKEYWKGEKSLRNYKKGMPIPFSGNRVKLSNDEKGREFKFTLFFGPSENENRRRAVYGTDSSIF